MGEYGWGQLLKDYWLLLGARRFRFVFWTVIRATANIPDYIVALLLGLIVDFFVGYSAGDSLINFYYMAGGVGALLVFKVWLRFFAKVRMQTMAAEVRKEVRVEAMSKLMDLSLKWHEKEETGSKIQKINEGGESIFKGIRDFSNQGIMIFMMLSLSLIFFAIYDWRYLVFGLVHSGIYLSGERYFNRKLSYWQDRLNKIKEKVSGKIHESASNLLTVKSLGLKEVFKGYTSTYEKKYYDTWVKKRDISQRKLKVIKSFSGIGYAGFILLLGFDVVGGAITVGSILVLASYFHKLVRALEETTHNMNDFIAVKSAIGRFMTIFGVDVFGREEKGKLDVAKKWKKIEFKGVTFKYKAKLVLQNFNLVIKRGEKIGIVGKTGCGKSTLVKLVLGLYTPQQGEILIDGKKLRDYKQKSLTDTIGVVLQESEMFNMPLLENITVSSKRKDLDRFKRAARISQLEPVIRKMPQGLNTLIGERGYKLSGGERQRVGLARAIYKNSSVLFLDEATSSLDSKTEALIQKGIEKELRERTLLIIAHRLSTLKNVDRVVMMERGKIVEEGAFKELVKLKKKFYALYKLQGR